jgi:glycerol uptake facilitator-like aquaporin
MNIVWRGSIMEFLGSFALTFASIKYMQSSKGDFDPATGTVIENKTGGMAIPEVEAAKMIFCLAFFTWAGISVSGAHYNPIVTISMFLSKKVYLATAVMYIIAQAAGSAAAAATQFFLTKSLQDSFTIPKDSKHKAWHYFLPTVNDCNFVQAFMMEAVATFIFVLAYQSMMVDKRAPKGFNCFCVGCAYGLGYLTIGYYTGGCLNPYIYLFPRLMIFDFTYILVYLLAPLAGGVVATIYFKFMMYSDPAIENTGSKAPIKAIEI